jgi:hypothetical protein
MVTNYKKNKNSARGASCHGYGWFWSKVLKRSTYKTYIFREPVQFTGFKLLQNDNWNKLDHVHSEELLQLTPKPSYIQFQ